MEVYFVRLEVLSRVRDLGSRVQRIFLLWQHEVGWASAPFPSGMVMPFSCQLELCPASLSVEV